MFSSYARRQKAAQAEFCFLGRKLSNDLLSKIGKNRVGYGS